MSKGWIGLFSVYKIRDRNPTGAAGLWLNDWCFPWWILSWHCILLKREVSLQGDFYFLQNQICCISPKTSWFSFAQEIHWINYFLYTSETFRPQQVCWHPGLNITDPLKDRNTCGQAVWAWPPPLLLVYCGRVVQFWSIHGPLSKKSINKRAT